MLLLVMGHHLMVVKKINDNLRRKKERKDFGKGLDMADRNHYLSKALTTFKSWCW